MCHRVAIAVVVALLLALAPCAAYGASLPVTRVTDDTLDVLGGGAFFKRDPYTALGQILFVDQDHTIKLFDGTTFPPDVVQVRPGADNVESHVFMLGAHSIAGQVLAAWRRATYGEVSVDGANPSTVTLNPEATSVADGCIFMVLQTAAEGNHAFQINPSTGGRTQLSSGNPGANHGAFRVVSGNCKAAWSYLQPLATSEELHVWNGTSVTVADSGIFQLRMAGDWIVYAKEVAGIVQVFGIDITDPLLVPQQLSAEDGSKTILFVETDGRHVAWLRSDGVTKEIVLAGGVTFPTGPVTEFSNERGMQLNRGQLLWIAPGGALSYFDGQQTHAIDPAPATTVVVPWLADGFIAFLGLHEDGGTDKEVFRITGTPPSDAAQPSPPMLLQVTPGTEELTATWDDILGATSYNLYLASEPGVTKDNYATLEGGRRISGVTSPHTVNGLDANRTYYVAVSAVDGSEGPSSHVTSTTVIGTLTWSIVEDATGFFSIAADPDDVSRAYAGANGSIFRSVDGGLGWTETLTAATTGANRVAALAVTPSSVFAAAMDEGDLWKSVNDGASWSLHLDATNPGELNGALAVAPSDATTLYAADFVLPDRGLDESLVIRSVTSGASWSHTAEGPEIGDEIHAYALAVHATTPTTLYAGGSGTPNVARSEDGGASWVSAGIPGGGTVYSIAIDPANPQVVWASTRDKGVFRSGDGGESWTAKNEGLAGVVTTNFGGAGFYSLLIDPQSSNYLHLGAGNGYWYSIDGGESWIGANDGLPAETEVRALALTGERRLLAATSAGIALLSIAPPPVIDTVTPATGDAGGGTSVTITGSDFQSGAQVTFGGAAATGEIVMSASTITASSPAHAAGFVDVVVTNIDGRSGSATSAFQYTTTPPPAPTAVVATATAPTSISIVWAAAPRATSYKIFRRAAGGAFAQIGTSPTPNYTDTVAPDASFLYRVQATNSAGTSPDSAADIATSVIFTNDPIAGVTTKVTASHLTQLRTAVNAVRQLAGSGAATYTDAAPLGVTIKAVHLSELRTALDPALTALGRTSGGYTDTPAPGLRVKAVHVQELRNRVK